METSGFGMWVHERRLGREYISGVGKLEDRLLILLDLDRLLSGEERDVLTGI